MDGGPSSEEELKEKASIVPHKAESVEEDGEKERRGDAGQEEETQWKWRKWLLVCVLWLAQVFIISAYSLIAPFFPTTASKKGSNAFITGVIISVSPLCLTICSPLFGYFLPQLGLKFTLISGMFLVGGVFLLMGFLVDMPNGWVFIMFAILLRMTEGVGWSMSTTTTFSLLAQLFPTHVGTVTGFMEVATGLGYSLGPPIGGLLYTVGGFRLPFHAVGGIILLFVPITMVLMKPTSCSSQSLPLKALFRLLSHISILVLVCGNVVCFASLAFFDPTFEPFLKEEFGLNQVHVGLVFLLLPAVYVPLALVVGKLSDKFGTRKFIISGFFISGISFSFLGPADFITKPQLWITIVARALLGIGLPSSFVPVYSDLLSQAHTLHPNEDKAILTSVVSGISTFSISLGQFVGPIVGGALVQISDFPTSSLAMGEALIAQGFLLLGVTLIDLTYPREKNHES